MTAALVPAQRHESRADQLRLLRRQMADISGKAGSGWRGQAGPAELPPAPESLLPVPEALAEALPAGLPRGTVAVLSGARSLALRMVAAATSAGCNVAVVGQPDIGLLAAAEMGADLSRLAAIPDPGADPVEVAAVLLDGMDLVLLGLGGRPVPAARARVVGARARRQGCTVLVADGDWPGASMRLEARVRGYETGAPGFGRISAVRLAVRARGRAVTRTGTG